MYKFTYIVFALTLTPFTFASLTVRGVQDEWPPYFHSDSQHKGKLHKKLEDIFCVAGIQFSVDILPWNRAYKMVKAGEFDVLLGTWKTVERQQDFYFSEPYYINQIKLISLQSTPVTYQDIKKERGLKIAVVAGYAYGKNIDNEGISFYETKSVTENIEFLIKNRVDAILMDEEVFNWNVEQESVDKSQFYISKKAVDRLPLYLAFSKNISLSKSTIESFNKALMTDKPCKILK